MSWKLECFGGSLFVCEHVEAHFGELSIVFERYLASPKRVSCLTEGAVFLIESFNKWNEWLLWSHSKTHSVIEDGLLVVVHKLGVTKRNVFVIYSPVLLVSWLVKPENVFVRWALLAILSKIIASKHNITFHSLIVWQIDTEQGCEVVVELLVGFQLGNKSCYSGLHWLVYVLLFGWRGWETDEARALERLHIFCFDDGQECQLVDTVLVIIAKACSVLRRMAQNLAFTIS